MNGRRKPALLNRHALVAGMTNALDDRALRYCTDKASDLHNYTRWYSRHFPRHYDVLFGDDEFTLLEIGISTGSSLRMWKDYYFESTIAGLDINPMPHSDEFAQFCGDQKDAKVADVIHDAIGDMDVVIDDGSHRWEDQIASFKLYWPFVKPGGWYVIEDLHTSYFMEFGEPGGLNTMQFLHLLMDDVNMYGAGGLGDCRNLQGYAELKDQLSIYQRTIESMTFYPSIVFIRKNDNAN